MKITLLKKWMVTLAIICLYFNIAIQATEDQEQKWQRIFDEYKKEAQLQLKEKQQEIEQKDAQLQENTIQLKEKQQEIEQKDAQLQQLEEKLQEIEQSNNQLLEMNHQLENRNQEMERTLEEMNNHLTVKVKLLQKKFFEIVNHVTDELKEIEMSPEKEYKLVYLDVKVITILHFLKLFSLCLIYYPE